jgi:hypothetical protein
MTSPEVLTGIVYIRGLLFETIPMTPTGSCATWHIYVPLSEWLHSVLNLDSDMSITSSSFCWVASFLFPLPWARCQVIYVHAQTAKRIMSLEIASEAAQFTSRGFEPRDASSC